MKTDLDTLLTALYVFIDDHVIRADGRAGRRCAGRPKRLTDAELVCLAVAQILLGFPSQHRWLRFCYSRLGRMFPYLPHQPGYHQRLNAAAPLIAATIDRLTAEVPTGADTIRLVDATVAPCGMSRQTARGSALADLAGYGYCRSHSRWIWGVKLYLVTALDGMPITWCLATPNLGERDIVAELLEQARDHHRIPAGVVLIGDKGFAGTAFEQHCRDLGIVFIRPDRRDETRRHGNLAPSANASNRSSTH